MSSVEDLLAQLAPGGVSHISLGELARTVPGLTGKTKSDFTDGNARYVSYKNVFAHPTVDQAASDFVKMAPAERQNRLRRGDVVITGSSENFEDVAMSSVVVQEPSEPLYLNSFCFAVRFNDPQLYLPDFSKHLFRSHRLRSQIRLTASGVTRVNVSKPRFLKTVLPVPPLEVQREIVRILDNFTELETELEAELEARRRQYAHYRDDLLGGRSPGPDWRPMGDVGVFTRGRRFTRADVVEGGIPSIHYGEIYTHYGVVAEVSVRQIREDLRFQLRFAMPGDLVIASVGETVEDVGKSVAWLGDEPVAIHDDTFGFSHSLEPKFVAYWMQTDAFHSQKTRHVASAKIKRLSSSALATILMPVPPVEEQRRIVESLDKFDALVNDISIGLPAELAARRKQYEHYRDKLLNFEEAS